VQVERRHHGGPEQAVYVYAAEDLALWAARLGRPLPPGSFGENLTVAGIDVTAARIGERWRIGTAIFEIGDVRTPCHTFQAWLQETGWIRRFLAEGRPGAYLRVLEEGSLRAGDAIEVVERRDHDVTVGLMFRALTTQRDLLPRLLAEPRTRPKALARARAYAAAHAGEYAGEQAGEQAGAERPAAAR
jgi:MOSC domain-containing protein YiiM